MFSYNTKLQKCIYIYKNTKSQRWASSQLVKMWWFQSKIFLLFSFYVPISTTTLFRSLSDTTTSKQPSTAKLFFKVRGKSSCCGCLYDDGGQARTENSAQLQVQLWTWKDGDAWSVPWLYYYDLTQLFISKLYIFQNKYVLIQFCACKFCLLHLFGLQKKSTCRSEMMLIIT